MTKARQGGCVCGAVRYQVRGDPMRVTVCHCTWCQRRTGSAFGVGVVFRIEDVTLAGETLNAYRHISDESGRWLDQQFCSRCGTNVGFILEAAPGIQAISAGTFDDPSWIRPDRSKFRYVYLRSARNWSTVPEGAECFQTHFRT